MTETSLETRVQDIILKCGGCSTPLQDPELPLISCPSCGAAHHVDCAAAQGKCSAYGCNSILEVDENKYLPGIGKVVYELGKKYTHKSKDFLMGFCEGSLYALVYYNTIWNNSDVIIHKNRDKANGHDLGRFCEIIGELLATSFLLYNYCWPLPLDMPLVIKTGWGIAMGSFPYILGKGTLNGITYVGYHAIKPIVEDHKKIREQLADPLYHKIKKLKEGQQQALPPAEEKKSNEDIK